MKKLCILIVALVMMFSVLCTASAESKTITLGNDTVANTTPFGNVSVNQRYQLFAGMVVTVIGEYDGWLVVKYGDEFGALFIETGEHNLGTGTQIPNAPGQIPSVPGSNVSTDKITIGIVGEGWQVWARYEPKSVFDEGESKGDKILHAGDEVEINGEIVEDEQGNEYYPIRMKKGDIYVQRYVTAKYIDIPIE
ncbi:MAG: hypothetical protein J6B87_04120 [Clostridia bacterium]|nr:hypothetical protein [Clostridia bacterium]MBP3338073.1 hypothetical protein [Lachnospiraceae bacterium]